MTDESPADVSGESRRLEDGEVRRVAERLDVLLEAVAAGAPPEVAAAVTEIADGLQRVHAEALRRLVEILAEDSARLRRALDDPVVSNLLLLYDLVVIDEARRAREAVETILPLARSHGGEIQLLGVEEGVVRVRLHGACHGCPSSSATLRQGIERALMERVPGFVRLEVEGAADHTAAAAGPAAAVGATAPSGTAGSAATRHGAVEDAATVAGGAIEAGMDGYASFVPEANLRRVERRAERAASSSGGDAEAPRSLGPLAVAPLDEIPREALFGRLVDGLPVLLVRSGDRIAGFRNLCPDSFLPLHLGSLEGDEIRCPWHGCRFDADTGERRGAPGRPLEPLATRVEGGRVWVEAGA